MRSPRAAAALAVVLAAACASRTVFRVEPSPRVAGPPLLDDGVAVLELEDRRGRNALDHNLKNLALLPLVPFSVSHRDYPERTWLDSSPNLNGFVPTVDLARALAAEIDAENLFARCSFVESGMHGERYALRGRLLDCHVAEGYLTYGISIASVILHVLAAPEGTLRCEMRFDLELVDRRDGRIVWRRRCSDGSTALTWIYASEEADIACGMFGSIAEGLIRDAVAGLRLELAARAAGATSRAP
ncbi:MAG TPA: hypothetical protein VKE69_02450 [Planctomycetota bacterium]|nr:hypothetical protein [Planctomycetota bacterium]